MRRLNIALAAGVLAVGALSGAEAGSALWQGVRGAYSGAFATVHAAELEHALAPAAPEHVALAPREQAEVERAVAQAVTMALLVGF